MDAGARDRRVAKAGAAMVTVYGSNWTPGYFLCANCTKDPDPRGWEACAACRELNQRTATTTSLTIADALGATGVREEIAALRAENRRACDARDEALAQVDALTRKLANIEVADATISHMRSVIARLLRWRDGREMSTHEEQADVREARAVVVEGDR